MKWFLMFCLAGLIGVVAGSPGQAAQPACKLYKVTAQNLYVSKDAKMSAEYIGVLERDNITCVILEKKVANRMWGYVSHKQKTGGQNEPINGWVGLRFMKLQSQAAAVTPTSNPKTAKLQPPAVPASPPVVVPKVVVPKVVMPKVIMPKIAAPKPVAAAPAPLAAPAQTGAANAEKEAANAYQATTAIGSCGAYKLFEEKYRSTFYGRLAAQFLQANCPNMTAQQQPATPGVPPVAVASAAPGQVAGSAAGQQLSIGALTISIQQELKRLGCNPGKADGNWGRRSRNAMSAFNRYTKLNLETGKPSEAALPVLRSTAGTICPTSARVTTRKPKKVVGKKKAKKPAKKKKSVGSKPTGDECESFMRADCF